MTESPVPSPLPPSTASRGRTRRAVARLAIWVLVLAGAVAFNPAISRFFGQPSPSTIPPTGVVLPSAVESRAIYVSPVGSDAGPGSIDLPLRTPQAAADRAVAGSTILFRAGTYASFRLERSGTPGSPIVISSYPGERAIFDGAAIAMRVISVVNAHDISLSHITIQGAVGRDEGSGLYINEGSHDVTVDDTLVRTIDGSGILIDGANRITVRNSQITDTATGIRIHTGGDQVLIEGNRIFGNARMIVNDPGGNNDYGAQGVAFQFTTGLVTVRNNVIYGQRAQSFDYGQDGAAFEVFGASNLLITNNMLWDNANVLETGTDATHECSNITFVRNIVYSSTSWGESRGMILRCAANSLIAHNTIDGLDRWAIQVDAADHAFGGSVRGLRVLNNILAGPALLLDMPVSLRDLVTIDYNLLSSGRPKIARLGNRVMSLEELQKLTGLELHGLRGDPRFVSEAARDYHLGPGSAAIDIGLRLPGINDDYAGTAPDAGRYEFEQASPANTTPASSP